MKPIRLSEAERRKPLSYDPSTGEFLFFADIKAGRVVSPQELDEESMRILTLKRLELEEPHAIESLGGLDKEQQMQEVREGTEKGKEIIQAWITNLTETIKQIQKGELE